MPGITRAPTPAPSARPTVRPSAAPSGTPTTAPSAAPTYVPSQAPTQAPTVPVEPGGGSLVPIPGTNLGNWTDIAISANGTILVAVRTLRQKESEGKRSSR